MGQYWIPVNLDKKEFISPHRLGAGLKLWEQLANHPSTGAALIILTAAMPESRGGGDFDMAENWHGPERTSGTEPGPMPEAYPEIVKRTVGRWAGDRITLIGDYAERSDLPEEFHADLIYSLCRSSDEKGDGISENVEWYRKKAAEAEEQEHKNYWLDKAERMATLQPFKDISEDVCAVIEHELGGKFTGDGWRKFAWAGSTSED